MDSNAKELFSANIHMLNNDQKIMFENIQQKTDRNKGDLIFWYALRSTNKSFLLHVLPPYVRKNNQLAIAATSSDCATTLLKLARYSGEDSGLRWKTVDQPVQKNFRAGVFGELPEIPGLAVLLFGFACSRRAVKAQECHLVNIHEVRAGQRNCLTHLRGVSGINVIDSFVTWMLSAIAGVQLPTDFIIKIVLPLSLNMEIKACFFFWFGLFVFFT